MTTSLHDVVAAACKSLDEDVDKVAIGQLDVEVRIASGESLRDALVLLDARAVALKDLRKLRSSPEAPSREEPANAKDLTQRNDFEARRFVSLAAYFGIQWCVYDLIGDFVARVLIDKDKAKDRTQTLNLVQTFFDEGKRPGFLPLPLRGTAFDDVIATLTASFELRNACLHQGLLSQGRAFFDEFKPTQELKDVADKGAGRAKKGTLLPAGLWDPSDFRETLGAMQEKTDRLVGILVSLSTAMLIEQLRHAGRILKAP